MVEHASSPRTPNVILAFLLLAYIFNFLDRQILGILAGPIKADLDLNDAQFGAIGGIAFALLYSVLAVPLAMLADRTSRSRVIAGSLAVWSGFTALCGTATGFWPIVPVPPRRRRRRGRRRRAVLCADRRLFPARSAAPARWRSSRSAFRSASPAGR